MKITGFEDWEWKPVADLKIGDKIAHWGSEDTVKKIARNGNWIALTLFDELRQKEVTHQYRPHDELLVNDQDHFDPVH